MLTKKDPYRHLTNQEYNVALNYTYGSEERRKELALRLFEEMVSRGYDPSTAASLIKTVYLIDITAEVAQ